MCREMRALQSTRPLPHAPHLAACSYSVFTLQSVHIPAKITGDNPITIHLDAAIDNANEEEELPLAPWH